MAQIQCLCGNRLSNSGLPEIEIYAYPSTQWENEVLTLDTIDPVYIPEPELLIWRCPKCRRLYVFPNIASNTDPTYSDSPIIYKVEKDYTKE